jgi:hypothetical protein
MKFENMNSDKFKAFENNQVAMDNVIGGTVFTMSRNRQAGTHDTAELTGQAGTPGAGWDSVQWHGDRETLNTIVLV